MGNPHNVVRVTLKGKIEAFQIQPMIFTRCGTDSSWTHNYRKKWLPEASFGLSKSPAATAEDRKASKLHTDITEKSHASLTIPSASERPLKDLGKELRVQGKDFMSCTVTENADAPHESPCGRGCHRCNGGTT